MQQGLIIVIVAVDAVDICDVQHGHGEGHQQQYKERHGYQLLPQRLLLSLFIQFTLSIL